jgi:hypothetical protein
VNPIRTATGLIQLPAHAAAAAMGTAAGVATTSARTTARVIGWAARRVAGTPPQQSPWAPGATARTTDSPVGHAPGQHVAAGHVAAAREVVEPATSTTAPQTVAKAPAKKAPAKKATAKRAAAKKAPATKAAAKKAAAKKAPSRKAPAKKAPSRKAPAKKAPSRKAAVVAPALGLSEAEAEAVLRTPSGTPAAGGGTNPGTATDLQPGTEPLLDTATAKAVKSESDVLRRAADTDKG